MTQIKIYLVALIVACVALQGNSLQAQARGGTPQTDKVQPVNTGANSYRVIRDWAHIDGRPWGGSNGVAIDRDGKTVWATDRCSPGTTPGCFGSNENPVHHFDESGKNVGSTSGIDRDFRTHVAVGILCGRVMPQAKLSDCTTPVVA